MASSARVANLSDGRAYKRGQAIGRVQQCISAWVEFGVSIRDLSMAESLRRSGQAGVDRHSPMPFAELPSTIYRPPENAQAAHQEEMRLMQQTNNRYPCECDDCTRKRAAEAKRAAAEALRFMARETLGVGG